jgi:flagellar hook-length control protein FliK
MPGLFDTSNRPTSDLVQILRYPVHLVQAARFVPAGRTRAPNVFKNQVCTANAMNSFSIESSLPTKSDTTNSSAPGNSEPTSGSHNSAFAQLYGQLHQSGLGAAHPQKPSSQIPEGLAKRQNMAAPDLSLGVDLAEPLIAWPISPQLEVIKPDTAAPDGDSVVAFAKSQGLSDETVMWLFKRAAMTATPSTTDLGATAEPATPVTGPAQVTGLPQSSGLAHASGLAPATSLAQATSLIPAADMTPTTSLNQAATFTAPESADGMPNVTPQVPSPPASFVQATMIGLADASPLKVLMPSATELTSGLVAQPWNGPVAGQNLQDLPNLSVIAALSLGTTDPQTKLLSQSAATFSPPPASPAEALAMAQANQQGFSIRAALAPNSQKASLNPPVPSAKLAPSAPLTLTIELSPELAADANPSSAPDPTSGANGQSNANAVQPGPSNPSARQALGWSESSRASANNASTDNPMASEKAADLSARMGQAIGERLLYALERGQWSVKLMLKPAHLGHIEVEMRMRNGELDASFLAGHAATRDLLQSGLGQLRASLNNAGMDIASMSVGDYQGRSSGGESTPGQRQQPMTVPVAQASADLIKPEPANGGDRSAPDGLDVMV